MPATAIQSMPRSRRAYLLIFGIIVAVLGGALAWSALDLRVRVREQIVQRDGEILDAVTVMQHLNDRSQGETIAPLNNPGEQFQLALEVSRLHNVLGVRLFSASGHFVNAFPEYITQTALLPMDLSRLQSLQPVSRYVARAPMAEQDLLAETNNPTAALLFVEVPLRTDNGLHLAGVIQFLMDGSGVARQYAALDRNLAGKFFTMFLVGSIILLGGLGLAMSRVKRANQKLAERTSNLLQANRELALAARTSAVGAVASHLIHGLKNPLSGLRTFVHAHHPENDEGTATDWQTALRTTQRMEELINRVIRVIQEQQSGVEYEISVAELMGMLTEKSKNLVEASAVRLETEIGLEARLTNREADLVLLILENLVQNAIEASAKGKLVQARVTGDVHSIYFEVQDQGSGLSAGAAGRLFTPCHSGKKGGGGIGLAISKQLAQSIGAKLELAGNSASGCRFRLTVPRQPVAGKPRAPVESFAVLHQPR